MNITQSIGTVAGAAAPVVAFNGGGIGVSALGTAIGFGPVTLAAAGAAAGYTVAKAYEPELKQAAVAVDNYVSPERCRSWGERLGSLLA